MREEMMKKWLEWKKMVKEKHMPDFVIDIAYQEFSIMPEYFFNESQYGFLSTLCDFDIVTKKFKNNEKESLV